MKKDYSDQVEVISLHHTITRDQSIEYFGEGEWNDEPDVLTFEHVGFKCLIKRIMKQDGPDHIFGGHLCGYVEISPDHLIAKLGFDFDSEVHGGITFSEGDENNHLIGFDCCHSADILPSLELLKKQSNYFDHFPIPEHVKKYGMFKALYRNMQYCIEQCKILAEEVKNYVKP